MAVMAEKTIDMAAILMLAYELGDWINSSTAMAQYLHWKSEMEKDLEVKQLIHKFAVKKQLFEECERFGHFHPDYHSALEQAQTVQQQLAANSAWKHFKQCEENMDELLYTISKTIAHSVSSTIKVPSNLAIAEEGCSSGGCSSGGGCSGKCG